jgi:ATP-dependent exoDNAse (exonuclease V) beta subunit
VVVLADDFQTFVTRRNDDHRGPRIIVDVNEANVAYVACTRAKNELWYGGAENVLRESLAAGKLPVTPTAPAPFPPTSLRRLQDAAASLVTRARRGSAPKPPAARTYRELTPGSRWKHPMYGDLETAAEI